MTTVEELIVAMESEGMTEVEQDLDSVDQSMQDTTDSAEQQSEDMDDFATEWQGAMQVVTAALAAASAFLLSRVPIIGELMSGLFAIVEGVAFQMDKVLRPVLGPLVDGMFDLADAIFEAEGPMRGIIGAIGTAAAVFGALIYFAGAFFAAVAALAAGILALAIRFDFLKELLLLLYAPVLGFIALAIRLWEEFQKLQDAIDETGLSLRDLVADAFQSGADFVSEFIDGIQSELPSLDDILDGIRDRLTEAIGFDIRANDRMAQRWGQDAVMEFGAGMEQQLRQGFPGVGQASDGGGGGGGGPRRRTERTQLFIDGRQASKQTRDHDDRDIKRRGRFG